MFKQIREKVIVATLVAVALTAIYSAWNIIREAGARLLLPDGAVIAFSEGCPENGWEAFDDLEGHFIIGAGNVYPSGTMGGKASYNLAEENLPSHSHGLAILTNKGVRLSDGGTGTNVPYFNLPSEKAANRAKIQKGAASFGTLSTGDGASISNIPPYVALTYCVKES